MPDPSPAARPPFRADHVGSLLRPERLKAARERLLGPQTPDANLGPHGNDELRRLEDDCIREVVALQERAGLRAVTDGELRRRSWWLEMIMGWDGFAADRTGTTELAWRNGTGEKQAFSRVWITGPIRRRADSAIVRAFAFLKSCTKGTPKVTVPAPTMIHVMAGGNAGIEQGHYKHAEDFWTDLTAAYRGELAALAGAGASYIQLDDTSIAFLCDPSLRPTFARWGHDPDRLLAEYAARINAAIAGLPPHVTVTLHQCRGNREGLWAAEGGYDPVADVMFNAIDVHGYSSNTTARGPARSRRCGFSRPARSRFSGWCRARPRCWRPPTR
jgi:5-methyltetrahydropteroyltriglutamate--homocysteine methyltransferase